MQNLMKVGKIETWSGKVSRKCKEKVVQYSFYFSLNAVVVNPNFKFYFYHFFECIPHTSVLFCRCYRTFLFFLVLHLFLSFTTTFKSSRRMFKNLWHFTFATFKIFPEYCWASSFRIHNNSLFLNFTYSSITRIFINASKFKYVAVWATTRVLKLKK